MKKSILIISSILLTTAISAQNRYDALKYSQQFYEGSARSIAMGNAFTSLGGDLGVLSINPASSAVYRYSEFHLHHRLLVLTMNLYILETVPKSLLQSSGYHLSVM